LKKQLLGAFALAGLALTGCGGDDESSEGDIEEYCRLTEETNAEPTPEDFERALDAAPAEIRDDLEIVFDAFRSVEDPEDVEAFLAAFEEPEVVEATENLDEFAAENCEPATSEE
jgi:hypothetical protein